MRARSCWLGSCDQHANISMPWQWALSETACDHCAEGIPDCKTIVSSLRLSLGSTNAACLPYLQAWDAYCHQPGCSDGILAGSQLLFGMMMRAGGQDADSGHRVRAMV